MNSNDQAIQRSELQLRADGFSERAVQEAVVFQTLKFHYACHRDNWDEYIAAFQRSKGPKWFPDPYVGPPEQKDSPAFDFWKCGELPSKAWEDYRGPILLIYRQHEGDSSVPEEVAEFRNPMAKATIINIKLRLFPEPNIPRVSPKM